ncbi:hypothetical protein M9H77_04289 [Catharanthus roseus]|uniref:Uncharacterized protein n=1 Tax=Catharanthus roseus TaxID=4058 RepID=A0ACC0CDN6_CATRO|nr:hypothetical protein M9H77_04289 [Catharanthus roseus]
MVEEVLCLSAERGYTVLYRNCEDNNMLSDIVVAHPTSIAIIRTWSYVLIMDTTYKTNKRHIDQNMLEKLTEMIKDEEIATRFINGSWHKLINEINGAKYLRKLDVLHFGVETTKPAESEHSVLKLWLSTCHGDLDTVFLNIDSVIKSQIAEIKSSLEISKLKKKFNAKSNPY